MPRIDYTLFCSPALTANQSTPFATPPVSMPMPSLSTLASSTSAKWDFCQQVADTKLYKAIAQVWSAFYNTISGCFSKIYSLFVPRTLPIINENLSPDGLKKAYWGLGRDNKWKECVDGTHHRHGRLAYDRGLHGGTTEPGFIASMENAFNFVEGAINRRVDADWYLQLHRRTCAHFDGNPLIYLMGQEKVGVFRNSDDAICCNPSGSYQFTVEAMSEFKELDQQLKREFGSSYGIGEIWHPTPGQPHVRLSYTVMSRDQVRRVFNKFLNEFYTEIAAAQTTDAKIFAIARLQQRLEWLHPVRDGTSRTSLALMNKLLTDYGLHPALLEYPHMSTFYSLRQWKDYLQRGLVKWEEERVRLHPTGV